MAWLQRRERRAEAGGGHDGCMGQKMLVIAESAGHMVAKIEAQGHNR